MKRTGFAIRQRAPMRRRTRLRPKRRKPGVTGRPSLDRQAWDLLKQQLWKRAEGRCEVCRKVDGLDPHHLVKRSQGGADVLDNLVALCRACHERTDWPYAKGRLELLRGNQRLQYRIVFRRMDPTASVWSVGRHDLAAVVKSGAAPSRRRPDQHPVVIPRREDLYPTVPQRRGR